MTTHLGTENPFRLSAFTFLKICVYVEIRTKRDDAARPKNAPRGGKVWIYFKFGTEEGLTFDYLSKKSRILLEVGLVASDFHETDIPWVARLGRM